MIGKSKILLVDDIEENLVALEALLRREDTEILFARSGVEALELVLVHDFALAFIDVQMPEMNGFELAELMRGSERSKYIPIIFVTAGTNDATRVFRGYESGAVDFLLKPLDPHAVHHKAETFIALDQQRKKLSAQYQLLQQSEALLREAVQAREDVLAVVSHDVRNFLQAIKSGVQLLTRRPEKLTDEVKTQIHTRLTSTVELMSRVIADLLDMANIRNGKIAVAPRPELIGNILNEAAAVHEPLADSKGIRLSVECAYPQDVVECDRQRVLQVLANLLGNAIKFCRQDDTIVIDAQRQDGEIQVSVRDSGPGIKAVDLPLVFEPYWSGGSKGQGTGLGLYITKRIIEAHERRIWIESTPGQGTSVHFTLKRVAPA